MAEVEVGDRPRVGSPDRNGSRRHPRPALNSRAPRRSKGAPRCQAGCTFGVRRRALRARRRAAGSGGRRRRLAGAPPLPPGHGPAAARLRRSRAARAGGLAPYRILRIRQTSSLGGLRVTTTVTFRPLSPAAVTRARLPLPPWSIVTASIVRSPPFSRAGSSACAPALPAFLQVANG